MGLRFGDPTGNPSTSSQRCTMHGCSGSSEGVPSPVRVQNRASPDAPPSGQPSRALSTPHDREHGGALGFTWESSYQATRDPTASHGVGQSHPPPSPQKPSRGSARLDVSLPRAAPWPPGTCQPLSAPVHESLPPAAALTQPKLSLPSVDSAAHPVHHAQAVHCVWQKEQGKEALLCLPGSALLSPHPHSQRKRVTPTRSHPRGLPCWTRVSHSSPELESESASALNGFSNILFRSIWSGSSNLPFTSLPRTCLLSTRQLVRVHKGPPACNGLTQSGGTAPHEGPGSPPHIPGLRPEMAFSVYN